MRRVLVTGAARGIGAEIGQFLMRRGYEVQSVDVLEAQHPDFPVHRVDLTNEDEIRRLPSLIGEIDILVNNAGVAVDKPLLESTSGDFDLTMAVNLKAPLLLAQAFVPGMTSRGWGRIINIGSVAARTGGTVSSTVLYAASKAGLMSMTRSLARELAPSGILVNSVVPGAIATKMAHEGRSEELKQTMLSRIPVARFGTPGEVATVVEFLCSDASSFVTGAAIDVNGGWHMS